MTYRTWTDLLLVGVLAAAGAVAGCRTNAQHLRAADEAARRHIASAQQQALGRTQPLEIVSAEDTLRRRLMEAQKLPYSSPAALGPDQAPRIKQWPKRQPRRAGQPKSDGIAIPADKPVVLSLVEALQVGARNSGNYQSSKEDVFRTALALELQEDLFRNTLSGSLEDLLSLDTTGQDDVFGHVAGGNAGLTRKLKTGASLAAHLSLDLAQLLNPTNSSSLGTLADATVTAPLLRGAGRFVAAEPLTQAQRDLLYGIWDFERFRKSYAVDVASRYLGVLQQDDQARNAEENYRQLVASTRRARRLADAGRLPQIQVEQALQDELRARERWIQAQERAKQRLDEFKVFLGLPTDAWVELDRNELGGRLAGADVLRIQALAPEPASQAAEEIPPATAPVTLAPSDREHGGPMELPEDVAVQLAFEHRLDLKVTQGEVYDAQRAVAVAANALLPGLSLSASARYGEGRGLGQAGRPDARLVIDEGSYSAGASMDLPWERTREAVAYRQSFIAFETAVRSLQELEDQIKLQLRNGLRNLLQARESLAIQKQAVQLAQRRVDSTNLFLQAGRAEIRDVLDAQEALISAQNALTAALVTYRISELEIQRDMGVLEIDEEGLWHEYESVVQR
jgi:outer membrane protein TolC